MTTEFELRRIESKHLRNQHEAQIPITRLNGHDTLLHIAWNKIRPSNYDSNYVDQLSKKLVSWPMWLSLCLIWWFRLCFWEWLGQDSFILITCNLIYLILQCCIISTINVYFAVHNIIQFESVYKVVNSIISIFSFLALSAGGINGAMEYFTHFTNVLYTIELILDIFIVISLPAFEFVTNKFIQSFAIFTLLLYFIVNYMTGYFLTNFASYMLKSLQRELTDYQIAIFGTKFYIRSIFLSCALNNTLFFAKQFIYTVYYPTNQFVISILSETVFYRGNMMNIQDNYSTGNINQETKKNMQEMVDIGDHDQNNGQQ